MLITDYYYKVSEGICNMYNILLISDYYCFILLHYICLMAFYPGQHE